LWDPIVDSSLKTHSAAPASGCDVWQWSAFEIKESCFRAVAGKRQSFCVGLQLAHNLESDSNEDIIFQATGVMLFEIGIGIR
jgi:hypothetical protein